jgi:hypothetical protein
MIVAALSLRRYTLYLRRNDLYPAWGLYETFPHSFIFAFVMNKFIHQATVFYLSLIILLRMMAMPVSLMEYSMNKNFIASTLCENKVRPEMHCNGRCFLNKKLAKSNDNQNTPDQKGSSKISIVDFYQSITHPLFSSHTLHLIHLSPVNNLHIITAYTVSVFRPPIA